MLTLTSKTRFGVMRGCQEQNREGDLGESPRFGWTGRLKADNILLVRWGVTFGIRARTARLKTRFGLCVAAKNKTVRGTWVEALDLGGLGGPKRTISC
ncbi:hypothetical protein D5086_027155 [Populus alba]|uniref:Uncharacterized protein n=1 Tax=Populus alba TaxID=43335 RepID=A0ACC4B4I5_POPAL